MAAGRSSHRQRHAANDERTVTRWRHRALIMAGILLCGGAAGLFAYGARADIRAARASASVVAELEERMPASHVVATSLLPRGESADATGEAPIMPTEVVDGFEYLGVLALPTIERTLPVATDLSDELLQISPCRYEGSYLTSDFIVCGEGYDGHFGWIGSLGIRDTVKFTAVDGAEYDYVVSNVETDELDELTAILHDWDLTLFTFRGDGTCLVIRCVRV